MYSASCLNGEASAIVAGGSIGGGSVTLTLATGAPMTTTSAMKLTTTKTSGTTQVPTTLSRAGADSNMALSAGGLVAALLGVLA